MTRIIYLIIFIFLFSLPSNLLAKEKEWTFVWVASGGTKYRVSQGDATVSIIDNNLSVDMLDENGVKYKIKGTISSNKVNAKFSVIGSGYFIDSPFQGTYKIKHFEGFADLKGRESITLTDGWNFIGLSREIKKP